MTMKQQQQLVNCECERVYDLAMDIWNKNNHGTGKRLRYCTAWVYTIGKYIYLESYNTIVAIIDTETDTCYDVLRLVYGYTATSGQHIAKFRRDYGSGKWGCNNVLRYYNV